MRIWNLLTIVFVYVLWKSVNMKPPQDRQTEINAAGYGVCDEIQNTNCEYDSRWKWMNM